MKKYFINKTISDMKKREREELKYMVIEIIAITVLIILTFIFILL